MKKLFYYWPVPLVIFSFADFFFDYRFSFIGTPSFKALTQISFFNQTHVLISFLLFHTVPSFQKWTRDFKIDNLDYKQKWIVNGILIFIFTQLCLQPALPDPKARLRIFYLIINIVGSQHILFQSFGFSMILSTMAKVDYPNDKQLILKSEKIERVCVQLLFWIISAMFIFNTFKNWTHFNVIKTSYFVSMGVIVSLLAYSVFLLPKHLRFKKALFLLRYLIFPLWPFSFTAIVAAWLFHGVEYVIFSDIVLKKSPNWNSRETKSNLINFMVIQIIFTFVLILMSFQKTWTSLLFDPRFVVLKGLIHTVIFMHFYFDRFAYRRIFNPTGFNRSVINGFGQQIR